MIKDDFAPTYVIDGEEWDATPLVTDFHKCSDRWLRQLVTKGMIEPPLRIRRMNYYRRRSYRDIRKLARRV